MSEWYETIKAVHIISIIAWMAGLLYLPRLFVYHAGASVGSEISQTFKVMERRLYRFIMNPAMIAALLTGGLMAWNWGIVIMHQGWFHVKLTAVILMIGAHHAFGAWRKAFEQDRNRRSAKFFKIANEVPTLLMLVIVFMVVLKPF